MSKLFPIASVICALMFINGCEQDKGEHPGLGNLPKIISVQILNANDPQNPIIKNSFSLGDVASFNIRAKDYDRDLEILCATLYQTEDPDSPYEGPDSISLPKQTSDDMTYRQVYSFVIDLPPGGYRMDFQLEDATGNKTGILGSSFSVE